MKKIVFFLLVSFNAISQSWLPYPVQVTTHSNDSILIRYNGAWYRAPKPTGGGSSIDTLKTPLVYQGRSIGWVLFDGTRWKSAAGSVSETELNYLDGVTSAIQSQIDTKQATLVSGTNIKTINGNSLLGSGDLTIPGGGSGTVKSGTQYRLAHYDSTYSKVAPLPYAITGNRVLISNSNGLPRHSSVVDTTELNRIDGLTSNAQNQIDTKVTNPMTSVGDLIQGGTSGTPNRLAGNTSVTEYVLTQTGTGTASQPAVWKNFATSVQAALSQRQTVGLIFDNTKSFSSSNYTQTGSTFTVNSGNITSSGAGNDVTFTNRLEYNYVTMSENYVFEGGFKVGTVSSTSYGFSFGINSTAVLSKSSYSIRYDCTNGANAGKLLAYNNGALQGTSNGAVPPAANDSVVFTIVQSKNKVVAKFFNVTQNKGITEVYLTSYAYNNTFVAFGAAAYYNIGRFCVWNHGNSGNVYKLKVTSNVTKNAQFMACGDSRTQGFFTTSPNDRWPDQVARDINADVVVEAAAGCQTADIITALPELTAATPVNFYLWVAVNDIFNSVPLATTQANYQTITNAMIAAGANVYVIEEIPRNGDANVISFNTWLNTTYGNKVVRIANKFGNSSNNMVPEYNSDNLHLNPWGLYNLAGIVEANLPTQYGYRIGQEPASYKATYGGDALGRGLMVGTNDAQPFYIKSGTDLTINAGQTNTGTVYFNSQNIGSTNTYFQSKLLTYCGGTNSSYVGSLNVNGTGTTLGGAGYINTWATNNAGLSGIWCRRNSSASFDGGVFDYDQTNNRVRVYASSTSSMVFGAGSYVDITTGGATIGRIDANGRLGIGTTSPLTRIHSTGSIRLDSLNAGLSGVAGDKPVIVGANGLAKVMANASGALTNNGSGTLSYDTYMKKIATITGVNAMSTGSTTVFTVPSGKTLVVDGYFVRVTSATSVSSGMTSARLISTGSFTSSYFGFTSLTDQGHVYKDQVSTGGIRYVVNSGETISFEIVGAAVGTSQTVAVDLFGYLY